MEKGQKRIDAEKNFSLWLVAAALMHAVVIFLARYWMQTGLLSRKL
jgi:hypothetical protein